MRFEIVDDLGHRFVQIDREQTQVTFSRGLVASGPAVETHDYGTVEAAVAAEQEVAARLNGLGFEDIGHDEDTLVIPMEWRRSFEQRRGGLRGVVVAVDPDAPEKLAEILAESEQAAGELIYESADPELASDDPCLVAATRTVLALHAFSAANAGRGSSATAYRKYLLRPFVDTWIAQQGLAFAATVVAEMAGLGGKWIPCRDEHEWHYRLRRELTQKAWLSDG